MEQIEEKHYCLCQLSQGGPFLLFPGLQQELQDLEGEHQLWYLGPEKAYVTRHLPGTLSVPSHSHPGASCKLGSCVSHSADCASHFPPKGIHIHVKTPRIKF